MKIRDRRSKRIIFVSSCVLNQNLRFPGIAVEAGACRELVEMLMGHDLGIEALPCLERLGWGGVSRRNYFRYQPVMLRYADSPLSRMIGIFSSLWLFRYSLLCRREARKVARHILDYLRSGYSVVGIIAMNDSPTDGVTRTIDLARAPRKFRESGLSDEVLKNPDIAEMKGFIHSLCEPGTGIFTSFLRKELEKRSAEVKILGFDPWADMTGECRRIEDELGLKA
jgi:predicted secreted protein